MSDILGYIVLTKQPDGSWKDDWDGEIHTTFATFTTELESARRTLGEDNAKPSVVREWVRPKATRRAVSVKQIYIVAIGGHALQDGFTGYCYSHGSFSCVDNLSPEEQESMYKATEGEE